MTYFLAGAALGLAGSVHCAGMCGPLLLALHRGAPRPQLISQVTVYHAARIAMYALLGIPAGYAAHALSYGMPGRVAAATGGILLLAGAAGSVVSRWSEPAGRAWSAAVARIGGRAVRVTRQHPHSGHAVLGALNGLLPCGLVYAAAAVAAASGTVPRAVALMTGFGVGTVPLLFAVTLSAAALPARIRQRLRFVTPALLALAGLLLIVRAFAPPAAAGGHHHQARERSNAVSSASIICRGGKSI